MLWISCVYILAVVRNDVTNGGHISTDGVQFGSHLYNSTATKRNKKKHELSLQDAGIDDTIYSL